MIRSTSQNDDIEFIFADEPVDYLEALAFMEHRVRQIALGEAKQCVWFLEHAPLYTAGTSAQEEDLVSKDLFPVYKAGRGGQYTYHGPGQRIVYIMLNLNNYDRDVRCFVRKIENWMIDTLGHFNVSARIVPDRVGVWVDRPELGTERCDKIGAIGIRVRKWVSFHGLSLNVEPDLTHYNGIIPCGISDQGVTSLVDLGHPITLHDVDQALLQEFEANF